MSIKSYINEFKTYLKLERGLSDNSIDAYISDVGKLNQYYESLGQELILKTITIQDVKQFISWLNELGMLPTSQSRVISGLKAFFSYLILEHIIDKDPSANLESPKLNKKLPDTLNIEEVNMLIASIDASKPEGMRNKAIIEVLYGCGLRVSELVGLKISDINIQSEFIKILGKGNKERIVPIGSTALKLLVIYIQEIRIHVNIKKVARILFS